jgi:transcriptional regulator with XRE-family HTH domain
LRRIGVATLRAIRRGKLISIEGLAEKAGVSTKTIVEIELGRSVPRLRTIRKLSEALEVEPTSVDEFAAAILDDGDATKKLVA